MTLIASVYKKTTRGIRFQVDDVKISPKLLPVSVLQFQLEARFDTNILALSHPNRFKIVSCGTHSLVAAVHCAFSNHYPLLFTPDMIWITIAQGFAQHINQNAEEFRAKFVKHQGKKQLQIKVEFPIEFYNWSDLVQQWSLMVRDEVGPELYRMLECNFTTTTPMTQTVSRIVMMETFQHYFDYTFVGVCGIPSIAILGTVEDWESIYRRVEMMSQYDLTWWTSRLLPICEEFIKAASGKPTLEFWRSIYKPKITYGTELITGWLVDLFPYIEVKNPHRLIKNPILAIERSQLTVSDGLSSRLLPLGLSKVTVKSETFEGTEPFQLIAGFIGVSQHPQWKVLQPELGWVVIPQKR